jgi:hypothetical protein
MLKSQNILVLLLICTIHNVESGMGKCPDGFKNVGGHLATKCVPCGPGWEDNPNSGNRCQNCPVGKFSDQSSNVVCTSCTIGKFPNSHSTACVDCPDGQFKNKSSGACAKCSMGTVADDAGQECVISQRKLTSEAREIRSSLLTNTFLTIIPFLFSLKSRV